MHSAGPWPVLWLLLALTATAAAYDVRTRRIPNWLTATGLLAGLALHPQAALLGAVLGFALYFPLWLLGARGAGDVKLLAAAGSLLGPHETLLLALTTAILGGILALALVLRQNALSQTAANIGHIVHSLVHFRRPAHTLATSTALRLPHALVILLAVVIIGIVRNGQLTTAGN